MISRSSAPPVCLTQQQIHTYNALQQSVQLGHQLTPTQQQYFVQLQHQYKLMQQQQARNPVSSLPTTSSPRPASSPCSVQSAQPELSSHAQGFTSSGSNDLTPVNQGVETLDRSTPKSTGALSGSPPFSPNVSDQELQAWLSQKDLGLGDDLLKNVNLDDFDLMEDEELGGSNNNSLHSINNNNIMVEKSNRILKSEVEQRISGSAPRAITSPVDSDIFHISLTAKELQERAKGHGKKGVTNNNIMGDNLPPPCPPEPPKVI